MWKVIPWDPDDRNKFQVTNEKYWYREHVYIGGCYIFILMSERSRRFYLRSRCIRFHHTSTVWQADKACRASQTELVWWKRETSERK